MTRRQRERRWLRRLPPVANKEDEPIVGTDIYPTTEGGRCRKLSGGMDVWWVSSFTTLASSHDQPDRNSPA